mmetsp:Transcript_2170/g.5161  ORF Transcript_2170/g.5161 Transcript_2170/m.5161 type:complete len:286 (-) Transcript_2170:970-1827(-)
MGVHVGVQAIPQARRVGVVLELLVVRADLAGQHRVGVVEGGRVQSELRHTVLEPLANRSAGAPRLQNLEVRLEGGVVLRGDGGGRGEHHCVAVAAAAAQHLRVLYGGHVGGLQAQVRVAQAQLPAPVVAPGKHLGGVVVADCHVVAQPGVHVDNALEVVDDAGVGVVPQHARAQLPVLAGAPGDYLPRQLDKRQIVVAACVDALEGYFVRGEHLGEPLVLLRPGVVDGVPGPQLAAAVVSPAVHAGLVHAQAVLRRHQRDRVAVAAGYVGRCVLGLRAEYNLRHF